MSYLEIDKDTYFYEKPIGYGSFSLTYKGFSYKYKKPIAIKKINKLPNNYLTKEIDLLKTIHHTNILQFYDIYQDNSVLYLIIEYCDGNDLSYYISSQKTEYDLKFYLQILDGLKYLYSCNILHKDLKPQNILISDNNIKITDFGLNKSFEKNNLIYKLSGSSLYLAPEIIKNKQYNDSSDLWSLGVILYELFVKQHPYLNKNEDELWSAVLSNNIKINFNLLNLPYRQIINKLLVLNVNYRITWDELIQEIDYIQKNENKNNIVNNQKDILNNLNDYDIFSNYSDCNIDNSTFNNKIYSKSNPETSTYLENYMKNQKINSLNIPILGTSPNKINNFNVLNNSINKVKNIFFN